MDAFPWLDLGKTAAEIALVAVALFKVLPESIKTLRVELRADRSNRRANLRIDLEAVKHVKESVQRLEGTVGRLESAVQQFSSDIPRILTTDIVRSGDLPRPPPPPAPTIDVQTTPPPEDKAP
jgi:hypothetical protein